MKKYAGVIAGLILASEPFAAAVAGEITAAKQIRAGSILTAADITTPSDRDAMRRAFELIGREAMRTYYRGQPINEEDFQAPTLVSRNSIVQMEFSKGAMTIFAEGRALDRGGFGDRIRVMNLLSKRVVSATVSGAGNVKAKHQ